MGSNQAKPTKATLNELKIPINKHVITLHYPP